jgi:hypothetical protein
MVHIVFLGTLNPANFDRLLNYVAIKPEVLFLQASVCRQKDKRPRTSSSCLIERADIQNSLIAYTDCKENTFIEAWLEWIWILNSTLYREACVWTG